MDKLLIAKQLLKEAISEETHQSIAALNDYDSFESYGIESVMMISITRKLEDTFGELPKTLFFEYPTIQEFAEYLVEEYGSKLRGLELDHNDPIPTVDSLEVSVQEEIKLVPFETKVEGQIISSKPQFEQKEIPTANNDDIAIIGISGRFPKAKNINEFWENLKAGLDCISEVPEELWDWKQYWDPKKGTEGKSYTKWGGFLDDIDKFDPLFFKISNLEAESLDPQERLFLETVYHTLEDAGYTKASLENSRVGVYVGAMWSQYQLYGVDRANAGSSNASIANRVSYYFDFNGPSIGLDTMCSSSLTTVHLACDSLKNGETDVAIAGGVNITVHPNKYLFLSKTGFASTDGRCRSFGEGGDGYVPGDGVGALLLKPLSKARRDGDQIYAVIKSTAINHGGKTSGYTVPNPKLQTDLVEQALTKANIDTSTISYMETHGTGTELGDPIEIRALTNAFKNGSSCPIGSVKSNIGHLESAAGFAGIAKVLMQMKYKTLVPSIHTENLNPNIDFTKTPFYVQRKLEPWEQPIFTIDGESKPGVRRAGVSSFGAGGANGFVLLEEYIPEIEDKKVSVTEEPQLIVLSAKNDERLREVVSNLYEFLSDTKEIKDLNNEVNYKKASEDERDNAVEILANLLQINKSLIEDDDLLTDFGFDEECAYSFSLQVNIDVNSLLELKTIKELKELILNKGYKRIQLNNNQGIQDQLKEIAYTLQVGREHMDVRIATIVSSVEELKRNLKYYLTNNTDTFVTGRVNLRKKIDVNEGDKKFISNLIKSKNYKKIAKLWCKGLDIDWKELYENTIVKRVSLPLYPFAKERCWVSNPTLPNQNYTITHPLLGTIDIKSSIGESLVYRKILDEQTILNYIGANENKHSISDPAIIDTLLAAGWEAESQGTLYSIELSDNTEILMNDYLVTEMKECDDEILITLSNGSQDVIATAKYKYNTMQKGNLTYQGEILKPYANTYSKRALLQILNKETTDLEELKFEGKEIICKFSASRSESSKQILPHNVLNSLIDGLKVYLQELNKDIETLSIGSIFISKDIHNEGYIYIKETTQNYFDAYILDESGNCLGYFTDISFTNHKVNVSGFFYKPIWTKVITNNQDVRKTKNTDNSNVLIVYPENASHLIQTVKKEFAEDRVYEIVIGSKTEIKSKKSWMIDGADDLALSSCIANIPSINQVYFLGGVNVSTWLPRTQKTFEKIQNQSTLALFRLVKALEENKLDQDTLNLKIITNNVYKVLEQDTVQPSTSALIGLGKTIDREYSNIKVEIIDIDIPENSPKQINKVLQDSLELMVTGIQGVKEYAIRDGQAYKMLLTANDLDPIQESMFKNNGVYVLIGGAGSVGLKISKYLAHKYSSHLVWIGRSEINEELSRKMKEVEEQGGTVDYYSVDIANESQVTKLFEELVRKHSQINGVIHSALAFSVGRIQGLTEEELLNTLKAKVDGGLVLSKVLENINLDFLVFFSSGESFNGNIGWGAYAAACNFKDALARHLQPIRNYPVHVINWGFWQGSDNDNERILHAKGIYPITEEQGAEVLERVLGTNTSQIMALNVSDEVLIKMGIDIPIREESEVSKFEQSIERKIQEEQISAAKEVATTAVIDQELDYSNETEIKNLVAEKIRGIFANVLKINEDKFELDADLANYGVDSLIVINLHTALEDEMGELPATIILEQPTIEDIAEYLIQNHFPQVNQMISIQDLGSTKNIIKSTPNQTHLDVVEMRTSSEIGIVKDVEVVRNIDQSEIKNFLENYGKMYQEKTLRNEENSMKLKEFNLNEAATKGLVQLVMKTPSCDEVEVIVSGKGKPILFLPAVALTAPVWIKQFELIRENYQLICIHAPSYGLSKTIKESTTEGVSKVFVEVLDRLNLGEPVNIVASCFGSIAATYLSRFYPEYVSTLSLVGGFYDNSDLPQFEMGNLKIEEIMQMVNTVSESLKVDFDTVMNNMDASHTDLIADINKSAALLLNSQCANPLVAMRYLNEMLTLSTLEWLPEIKLPTQCIYGDLDTVVSPERSKVLNDKIPNSKIIEVTGSGHYPFLTHPQIFNSILEGFLNENSR
ncbi:alpha/beta fold hydrolase [Bacillus anthracis]|uniref:alpha/beta fold hydrolase n=1 Tax=Bacillus anthracis TaxID=1392 RepID=UPI003B9DD449